MPWEVNDPLSVSRVGLIAQSGAGAATLVGKALAKRKPVLLIGGVIALVAALVPLLVLADDPTAVQAAVAADTVWVITAACFVMFMQAGFAMLEVGFSRMKNVGTVVAKVVTNLSVSSIAYWAVGFGFAFGAGGMFALIGGRAFFPTFSPGSTLDLPAISFSTVPAAAKWFFEFVFCAVSLAIVWGTMLERTKFIVYILFGVPFAAFIYPLISHQLFGGGYLMATLGSQDFAGSTVVHLTGATAGLAGLLLLGPRIGKYEKGRPNAIPGHNMPLAQLGVLILWFGWFGFNPGSTLGVVTGNRIGYFGYVALTTNIAAAAGAIGGLASAWLILRKPDISMMLNGVLAALVAITAASGFVAPWAAIVIGLVSGWIAVAGVLFVERIGIDDPIGAVAVHGMSGVWGTLACGLFAVPVLSSNLATGTKGLVYGGGFHQLGVQSLGLVAVGAFTFGTSFACLYVLHKIWGIRVDPQVESDGLDVHEHGMWGYPEFYIPVPGGYGTESHSHLGSGHRHEAPAGAHAIVAHPVASP